MALKKPHEVLHGVSISCQMEYSRWSNFIKMHIGKELNQSSLLTLVFIKISRFFLLLKFKLLINNSFKNIPDGVPRSQNIFLLVSLAGLSTRTLSPQCTNQIALTTLH